MKPSQILCILLLLLGPLSLAQASGCHTATSASEHLALAPSAWTQSAEWTQSTEEARTQLPVGPALERQDAMAPDDCGACDLGCLQGCASVCAMPIATEPARSDALTQTFAALNRTSHPSHTLPLLRPPTRSF